MAKYVIELDDEYYKQATSKVIKHNVYEAVEAYERAIRNATPLDEEFEWCNCCKEYDTEKHCCHRWSKIIRNTLNDNINVTLEDIKADVNDLQKYDHIVADGVEPMIWLRNVISIIDNYKR